MRPIDARSLPDGTALETDLCIVGAGPAGISLACALADTGVDVLLVEGGDLRPDAATQALHEALSVGYPLRPNYLNRARQFGGTSNLWAGRNMLLWPEDLAGRDWVPGSAWPIAPAEIAVWHDAAARLLGLPDAGPFSPARWRPQLGASEAALFASGRLVPTVSIWARRPMRFGVVHGPTLRRAGNIRTLLRANAVGLRQDAAHATVTGVELATLGGPRLEVRARRIVLAAGGIENARLLLLAELGGPLVGRFFMEHPRAVFGKVELVAGRRVPLLRGRPFRDGRVQIGMALAPEVQRREGLLNHYCTLESEVSDYVARTYEAAVDVGKVLLRRGHAGGRLDFSAVGKSRLEGFIYQLSPKEILPHWAFRAVSALRDRYRPEKAPQRCVLVTFCEQPPDPASRVWLGPERDALGLPRPEVDWRIPESVPRSLLRLHEALGRELAERGLGRLEPGDPATLAYTDASHHLGTTRMSDDPATGVVDRDGRVHGTANLWVAGSSVFPSGGHANPTLTIVALALRLAARLRG